MSDWTSWLPSSWLNAGGLGPSVQVMLAVSILGLLPSVFLLTTCWMRFVVVLGLLRQAIGGAQILPNQVITGLSLMLTIAIMAPVWEAAWQEGVVPYQSAQFENEAEQRKALGAAVTRTLAPVRRFMISQIQVAGNENTVALFLKARLNRSLNQSRSITKTCDQCAAACVRTQRAEGRLSDRITGAPAVSRDRSGDFVAPDRTGTRLALADVGLAAAEAAGVCLDRWLVPGRCRCCCKV